MAHKVFVKLKLKQIISENRGRQLYLFLRKMRCLTPLPTAYAPSLQSFDL